MTDGSSRDAFKVSPKAAFGIEKRRDHFHNNDGVDLLATGKEMGKVGVPVVPSKHAGEAVSGQEPKSGFQRSDVLPDRSGDGAKDDFVDVVGYIKGSPGSGGPPGGGNDDFDSFVGYYKRPTPTEKVANSLLGLFVGPLLIICACFLLWHNESWSIKTHRSLEEGRSALVEVPDAQAAPDPINVGKLVHVSGQITFEGSIIDSYFGLSRSGIISLTRHVEIYQWVEHVMTEHHKLQNGDTEVRERVSYRKEWVQTPISTPFRHPDGHRNVGDLPLHGETQQVIKIRLGAYILDAELSEKIDSGTREVPVAAVQHLPDGAFIKGNRITMPYHVRGGGLSAEQPSAIEERIMLINGKEQQVRYVVKATGDSYSTKAQAIEMASRNNPASRSEPEIGDVRVYFTETPCPYVSVLARLTARNMLTSWSSSQGSGYDVAILSTGEVSAQKMIETASQDNGIRTWALRGVGWLLTFSGFSMVTSIVSTVAGISLDWIPLLGPLSSSLIELGLAVANGVMATSLSLAVVSTAWLFYRPVLGASILVGAIGMFFSFSKAGDATKGSAMGK